MTDLATLPTVPPIVGGIFRMRSGDHTGPVQQTVTGVWTDGRDVWKDTGKYHGNKCYELDLVELIAVAVPVAELAQLRRAEALCRAAHIDETCYGSGSQQEHVAWLAQHTKATP